MKKARITIDTSEGKIRVQSPRKGKQGRKILINIRPITIQPMEEAKVMAECSTSFDIALKQGHNFPDIHVMDGLVQESKSMDGYTCNVVNLNFGREPLSIPKGMELGSLTDVDQTNFSPMKEVLQIHQGKVRLHSIEHIKNIKLDHLPKKYCPEYEKLILNYADIFSKHDLDIGHSKTLSHVVWLTNPHKIVSINQYRLPYHLKEVKNS